MIALSIQGPQNKADCSRRVFFRGFLYLAGIIRTLGHTTIGKPKLLINFSLRIELLSHFNVVRR